MFSLRNYWTDRIFFVQSAPVFYGLAIDVRNVKREKSKSKSNNFAISLQKESKKKKKSMRTFLCRPNSPLEIKLVYISFSAARRLESTHPCAACDSSHLFAVFVGRCQTQTSIILIQYTMKLFRCCWYSVHFYYFRILLSLVIRCIFSDISDIWASSGRQHSTFSSTLRWEGKTRIIT